jgi:quercetin dioxygenase-like cupin family protein
MTKRAAIKTIYIMSNSAHSNSPENWPKKVIVPLQKPFADNRGVIQPLVDATMRSALIITSKKGTVRANHYHKTDWHYCYVLSGSIEYHHRPVGSKAKPGRVLVKTGELFFTPPLVEHAMVFPEDTTFLTLSCNKRDQKAYEEDLIRIELVKP